MSASFSDLKGSTKLVPRDKLEALIKNYEAMLNEFRLDLNQRFESALGIASGLEGQVSQDEEFFLRLRVKIQQLEGEVHQLQEKVNHLSNPLEYRPATRTDMKVANIIIRYFQHLGLILDRSHSDYESYQATLWFFVDRNQRLVLADELNEHSDKLQALAHTLNSPSKHLGWITTEQTLRVLDTGHIRRTQTPDRVIYSSQM